MSREIDAVADVERAVDEVGCAAAVLELAMGWAAVCAVWFGGDGNWAAGAGCDAAATGRVRGAAICCSDAKRCATARAKDGVG